MNLLYVLPRTERWDGPAMDVADVMSRLCGAAVKPSSKHSLGRRRDEADSGKGDLHSSKRSRK